MAKIVQISPSATGAEARVNTTANFSNQATPSVAALEGGGYVVSWDALGNSGESEWGIFQQRYDSSGSRIGGETHVNTTTAGNQMYSSTAGLEGGGHVVTWQSADGAGSGIFQQLFNSSGVAVGSETRVNTTVVGHQELGVAAGLTGGGHVVSWTSLGQDGAGPGVYLQRYDATGTPLGSEIQVNTTTEGEQSTSSVAATADGGFVVTWHSMSQDGSNFGIYQQRYDASGNPAGSETQVNTYTGGAQMNPTVIGLKDGGHVVAWQSLFQERADYTVHAQVYDSSGALVGSEISLGAGSGADQINPKVVAMPDGGFDVLWFSYVSEAVFQQRFDASGVKIGPATAVATGIRTDFYTIGAAALEDGGIVASWTTDKQNEAFYDVYHSLTPFITTMSPAVENVIGDGTNEIILVGSGGLNAGDTITGGAGTDVLRFEGGGTNTAIGATISGIEAIEFTNNDGTVLTAPTAAMALLVTSATGTEDRIDLASGSFTVAQRRALFDKGVETLSDGQGTFHSSNAAPALTHDSVVRAKEDNSPVLVLTNDSDDDGDSLMLVSNSLEISAVTPSQGLTLPLLFGQPMTGAAILSQFVMNDNEISLFNESLFEFLEAGQSVTIQFSYQVSDGVANVSNGTLTYKVEVPGVNLPDPDPEPDPDQGGSSSSSSALTSTVICRDASGALPSAVGAPAPDGPVLQPIADPGQPHPVSNVDGGRYDDVLFQNGITGKIGYIDMTAGKAGAFVDIINALPQGWSLVEARDLNGDGRADIIVQNKNNGSIYIANLASGSPNWSLAKGGLLAAHEAIGIGDITGDGRSDVLIRDAGTGQLFFASLDRSGAPGELISGFDTGFTWRTVGLGDVNRDGASDILVQEIGTGVTAFYDAKNKSWGSVVGNIGEEWIARTLADLNGDGRADVVFRNSVTGDIAWVDMRADGDGLLKTLVEDVAGFDLVGSADVDGDGSRDLILQSPTDGATAFVDINAGTAVGWGDIAKALSSQWSAVA